jgi:DNA-binding CsgD family transcriptional regulator
MMPAQRSRHTGAVGPRADRACTRRGDTVLRGRRREQDALEELLRGVRAGESRVLVLRGEPGVGKTALLDYTQDHAAGCRVVRVAGVQSEMELAFAGLHQLCAPQLERLARLPGPQRAALGTALGLRAGSPPDRFFLGLAVLGLLREIAVDDPVVCLVDDVQWLDQASAQVLAFVARRLAATPVAVVLTLRDEADGDELRGLPELRVEGLDESDARALLASVIHGRLDDRVRDRIVAETRGNPLALLELPRDMPPAELAAGFALQDAPPMSSHIEDSFHRRLLALPAPTRWLLLLAAAEPLGDPVLLWRAAHRLGVGVEAARPAAVAGLAEFGRQVRFRHPLVRSAVYRASPAADRHRVHEALAAATDPLTDPDRRAWHRARAAPGPDEEIAGELARSAGRAQARGGLAAAAALLEQATQMTLDPALRARRALAAAQAKHDAGAPEAALDLLAAAAAGPLDDLHRARVDRLRAQVAFAMSRSADAPPLLLKAAVELEALDIDLARETYLDALSAGLVVGRLGQGDGLAGVARAARAAPAQLRPPRAADILLDGLARLLTEGYASGAPTLRRALRASCRDGEDNVRWLWLTSHAAALLWDDEAWDVLSDRHVAWAREAGALSVLPLAMTSRIGAHLWAGRLAAAASLVAEVDAVTDAWDRQGPTYGALALAAFQGREAESTRLIEATMRLAVPRGEGLGLTVAQWATALLYNSLGRHDEALAAAQQASCDSDALPFPAWPLVELVEAATRVGSFECASDALARLAETTRASGTDWALGIEARSQALVTAGRDAEAHYREAIDRLGRSRAAVCLARAHLLYGEWLRRERRRGDAREQLHVAHEQCTAMGLEAFARRAAHELRATGETARRRTVDTRAQLTAQEAQIARLAGEGLSNPTIGARLFISPRTVEYHLHKVFGKLNINSRKQLERALSNDARAAQAV